MAETEWVEGDQLFAPKTEWVEGHMLEAGQPRPPPEPGVGEAILRGGAQGATLGFADESAGTGAMLGALSQKYMHMPQLVGGQGYGGASNNAIHPLEAYKEARDAHRAKDAAAKDAHPVWYGGAEFAGSIPTAFVPGLGIAKGAGLGTTLARTAGAGALAGLGSSEGKTAVDDALAALAGAGIGGALGGVGYRLGRFGQKAAEEVRLANADAAQAMAKKAGKTMVSARGAYGGDVADVLDVAKAAEHALESPMASAEQKAAAQAKLADPEFVQLYRNALDNKLAMSAEKQGGRLLNSRAAYESAKAATAPEAIEAAAEESMAQPFRRQVLPRVVKYGERFLPAILGYSHGGLPGAIGGAAIGAVMGSPGTSFSNMMLSPGVRRAMWSGLEKVSPAPSAAGWLATHGGQTASSLELSPKIQAMLTALKASHEPEPQWEP